MTVLFDPSAQFTGVISLDTIDAEGVLQVSGTTDVVTVTYVDADDGQGGIDVVNQDTADVDCLAPVIVNVQSSDVSGLAPDRRILKGN